jgi:hypothetical protein
VRLHSGFDGIAARIVKKNFLTADLNKDRGKVARSAVAASLTIVYHILRDGTRYSDLGPEYFAGRNPGKLAAKLANRTRNLDYHVEISTAAA